MTATPDLTALHAYIALRQQGDRAAARAAAQAACRALPNLPAAHYALGEASAALGDQNAAAAAFAEAVRLAPGWADGWVNYGLALYQSSDISAAKAAFRAALRAEPGHAGARANLAALLRISGEAEESTALLRETLAQAPAAAAARLNLAVEELQADRPREALQLLAGAPALPDDAETCRHWHLTACSALLRLGQAGAARAALEAALALGPLPPSVLPQVLWRRVQLAQLANDRAQALAHARAMQAALAEELPGALPEHLIMAHYDLAKFFSGNGDRAAAFAHWSRGHAICRPMHRFSRADLNDFIEANIRHFDAAAFSPDNVAGNRDQAPVFIVGMPRSGTSLCEQILASHRDVHGAGERGALSTSFSALAGDHPQEAVRRIATLPRAQLDEAAAAYLRALHALAPDKARIVDKMPGNELYAGLIGRMLPGARIIHCVRDPRDIGLSIWSFRFHGVHPYAHDLEDLGTTIAQRNRLVAHWQRVLPAGVYVVQLRDWVDDFDTTLQRLLAYLDLPPDPACARFYETDRAVNTVSREQVRQPINSRGIGRWRDYAAELQPLIAALRAGGMVLEGD